MKVKVLKLSSSFYFADYVQFKLSFKQQIFLENVPLSSSSLQKSQYVLKLFIFSLPDHIEYNSLTDQFTRLYILISALVLVFGYTGISGHCWLLLVQSHVQYNGVKFATPYSHATW